MDVKKKKTCVCVLIVALLRESCGAVDQQSVKGDSATLNTDVLKPKDDTILWYFNDIEIAVINGHPNTSCLYDGPDGRFRGRLKVDYETGSLIIDDITSEHAGRYEARIIKRESSGKHQPLNKKNLRCNSTKITRNNNFGDLIKTIIMNVSGPTQDPTTDAPISVTEPDNDSKDERTSPLEQDSGNLGVAIGVPLLLVVVVGAGAAIYCLRSTRKPERPNKRTPDDGEVIDGLMQDKRNKPEEV